jgi:hypothetical protein
MSPGRTGTREASHSEPATPKPHAGEGGPTPQNGEGGQPSPDISPPEE